MSNCSPYPELLPEWLADKAVDDELFAHAYESCSNAQRGWLKKTISLHFALAGEAPAQYSLQMEFPRLGVRSACFKHPADWCVLLLPQDVASPVRALAAVVPAMLAGVRELIVVRQTRDDVAPGPEWPAGLLVGLELAGVRRIFDLSPQETAELLQRLLEGECSGRILMLDTGKDLSDVVSDRIRKARQVRSWIGVRPHIGVCRRQSETVAGPGDTLESVLAWAHPDVTPVFCPEGLSSVSTADYDALLVAADDLEKVRENAVIVLGPGVEGCWFWPDLDRDFFLRRTLCCSSIVIPESE